MFEQNLSIGAIDSDIMADTQYRDQDLRKHTGKKTFDVEQIEFEEISRDNGGDDQEPAKNTEDNPGF